jgi:hypothetical protein
MIFTSFASMQQQHKFVGQAAYIYGRTHYLLEVGENGKVV